MCECSVRSVHASESSVNLNVEYKYKDHVHDESCWIMFSQCFYGFAPSAPTIQKHALRLIADSKLPLGVTERVKGVCVWGWADGHQAKPCVIIGHHKILDGIY